METNQLNELINDYKINFLSLSDLARKNGISKIKLNILFKENNIEKRDLSRRPKKFDQYNINPEQFLNIKTPETAYILGLLWADGYVSIKKGACPICISSTYPDSEDILKIIKKTGKWGYHKSHKVKTWKESVKIYTNNFPLANFLLENDYHIKSGASADKILSKIPEHLKHYFFRGLMDGDGCIYLNKSVIQVAFASNYEQNWTYLENLCNSLGVQYSIKRHISKKGHKSSVLRIINKKNCLKFLTYIYQGTDSEKIYLHRKYKKYLDFIEYVKKMNKFHTQQHINATSRGEEGPKSRIIDLEPIHYSLY